MTPIPIRCCENCQAFIGRNDVGVPICGATASWQQRAEIDHALRATNAKNRCALFNMNLRAADDEGEIFKLENSEKKP